MWWLSPLKLSNEATVSIIKSSVTEVGIVDMI